MGPSLEDVSCIACIDLEEEGRESLSNVHSSVAEAANWRISELMSWMACRTWAPDQLSVRVMYISLLRVRARSSSDSVNEISLGVERPFGYPFVLRISNELCRDWRFLGAE